MKRFLALTLLALAPLAAHADNQIIKIATLAPEGTTWMKEFHEWGTAIEKRTNGAVKVKFYPGGVQGDERDCVRKMKLGQITGAAVTGIGLGLIQPEVRIFDLPFLFKNVDELDYVRNTLDAELHKKFEDKGYILLAWGDVGPVHVFSNQPLSSDADVRKAKLWQWGDDPMIGELFKSLGLNGVKLGVPDVLPSLQTGMIDACYGSPYSTLALQWYSKVKFITSMVIGQATGATVITKAAWDHMAPDQQTIVLEESKKMEARVLKHLRDDNVAALKKMQSLGLTVVPTPPAVQATFEKAAGEVRPKLDGQLYTKDFRTKVEGLLAQKRGK